MSKAKETIFKLLSINNLILVVIVILCMWIGYNQTRISTNNKIKDNVSLVADIISREEVPEHIIKYEIRDNGIFHEGIELRTSEDILGKGIAFYDKNGITIVVEYEGRCVMKLSSSGAVFFYYEECDEYDLVMGIKFYVSKKGYGIYREGDSFVYRGPDLNNNLIYKNKMYRITSFNQDSITIIENSSDSLDNLVGEGNLNQTLTLNRKVISGDGSLTNPYQVDES